MEEALDLSFDILLMMMMIYIYKIHVEKSSLKSFSWPIPCNCRTQTITTFHTIPPFVIFPEPLIFSICFSKMSFNTHVESTPIYATCFKAWDEDDTSATDIWWAKNFKNGNVGNRSRSDL